MLHAKENVVLLDSSKFDREGIINFATLNSIHTLVTDSKIPPGYFQHLKNAGINAIVADENFAG
jgi:DeoR/GlpR family transcriptional regulator of sugar metabolism